MRRLQGTSDATQLVVTVSVLAAALGLADWLWSPQEAHPLDHFWEGDKISIGASTILKFTYQDQIDEHYQKQLFESALRDGLTNTFNRRYFLERMKSEFQHS